MTKQHGIFYTQGSTITIVFPNALYCFVYLYTWKVILGSWSADSNVNWQIWHRREQSSGRLAGQGWHQGTLRFPLCPPAWFCLTTCSILTRKPACTQRSERRQERGSWHISDVTMSPGVISLIRQGQHWGGVRTRAVTILVTRSEAGIFQHLQIYFEYRGKYQNKDRATNLDHCFARCALFWVRAGLVWRGLWWNVKFLCVKLCVELRVHL